MDLFVAAVSTFHRWEILRWPHVRCVTPSSRKNVHAATSPVPDESRCQTRAACRRRFRQNVRVCVVYTFGCLLPARTTVNHATPPPRPQQRGGPLPVIIPNARRAAAALYVDRRTVATHRFDRWRKAYRIIIAIRVGLKRGHAWWRRICGVEKMRSVA
jgi:hypothetical protein